MASRRTVTQVLQTASRLHLQQAVATASRRSGIVQQSPSLTRPSLPRVLPRATIRAYSQASQESKIWSFEDIQKLSQEAKPSVTIIGRHRFSPYRPRFWQQSNRNCHEIQMSANRASCNRQATSRTQSTSPSTRHPTASTSQTKSSRIASASPARPRTPRLSSTARLACAAGVRPDSRATPGGPRSASIRAVGRNGSKRTARWRGRNGIGPQRN